MRSHFSAVYMVYLLNTWSARQTDRDGVHLQVFLQWRTQKIFMGEVSLVVIHFYFVCAVCDVTIWSYIHFSKPTFWWSWLTQYAYSSTRTVLILCVIALNINNQRPKLDYRRKIHLTQQFTTAKIPGCSLKQGNKTHTSLNQSNLQLQNQAALMLRRKRAVEHRTCAAGLVGAHPGWKQQFYHATEFGYVANAVSDALIKHSRQNKDNCFG